MDAEKKKGKKRGSRNRSSDDGRDVALENKLINTRRAIIPPRIVSRRYLPPGCDYKRASVYYSRLRSSVFHAEQAAARAASCFRQYSDIRFISRLAILSRWWIIISPAQNRGRRVSREFAT